jgi:hypothetical protein
MERSAAPVIFSLSFLDLSGLYREECYNSSKWDVNYRSLTGKMVKVKK